MQTIVKTLRSPHPLIKTSHQSRKRSRQSKKNIITRHTKSMERLLEQSGIKGCNKTKKRVSACTQQTALPLRKWIWKGTSVCLLFVSGRLRIWWAWRQTAPWSESSESWRRYIKAFLLSETLPLESGRLREGRRDKGGGEQRAKFVCVCARACVCSVCN